MFNGIHHTVAKINGKSLGYACRPPSPACSLNQKRGDLGIPNDSFRWENALVRFSEIRQKAFERTGKSFPVIFI